MAEINYDELTIEIKANTKDVHRQIKALSTSLDDLSKQAEKMNLDHLRDVQRLLQDIANIDFSKVSSGLYSVVKTFDAFNSRTFRTVAESLKSVEETAKEVKLPEISPVSGGGSIEKMVEGWKVPLKNVSTLLEKVKGDVNSITKISSLISVKEMTAPLTKVGSTLDEIFKRSTQFTGQADYSKESIISINHLIRLQQKELEKEAKLQERLNKKTQGLQKIAIKIKSLALYRVIRLALMKIQQTIGEAIQSLAQYDANFNKSISEISSSFKYLARSLVALLNPIVQLLSPIITFLNNALGELINTLGALIGGALGQSEFVSATQVVDDYAESLKKAKNAALGIDELNILSPEEDTQYWQEQEVEAQTGLSDMISNLIETIKPIFSAIGRLLQAIQPILEIVCDLINDMITDTSELVNGSIESLIDLITSLITLLGEILTSLKPLLDLLNTINSSIINLINGVLKEIFEVLDAYVLILGEFLKPILEFVGVYLRLILSPLNAIIKLIGNGITWLISNLEPILLGLVGAVKGLLSGDWANDFFKKATELFTGLWDKFVGKTSNIVDDLVRAILGAIDSVGNFFNQDWGLVENYGGGIAGTQTYNAPSLEIERPTYSNSGSNQQAAYSQPDVNIYLDGKQIARVVNKRNDNAGANIFSGGALVYGK